MPVPIRATDNMIEETQKELLQKVAKFLEELKTKNLTKGNISFNQAYTYDEKDFSRPIVEFAPEAWMKMVALISTTSSEIAWNGVVDRKADDHYYISDILVYPQKVTGATVDPDEGERSLWLSKIPREQRCKLGFQGHSHVNMSPSPSGTDMVSRAEIVQHLSDEDFYIFMIMNKSYEFTMALYDMKTNALYDTKDIDVVAYVGDDNLLDWCKEEKKEKIKTSYYSGSYNSNNKKSNTTPITKANEKEKEPASSDKKGKSKSKITAAELHITASTIVNHCIVTWKEAECILEELLEEVNNGQLTNNADLLLIEADALRDEHEALMESVHYGGLYGASEYYGGRYY